ncbi:carotenoid biosynthesis protein [Paracrocinitomix mangrovi]|uniref:carotenoid biosynthesis protein n=1 Tax=Paracrocinitomix mangrovi TaxID=2862509 RepID=UPI001C8E7ECF|nr:carotenoid biosynthesis protein [Paracrocinitomix mangrovi]UKN03613.1 carotenoid biosynthesis protein [Paracrocinitomix mangrovi]
MDKAIKYFPLALLIFHMVGIGIFLYFKQAPELSFVNILLSAILVFVSEKDLKKAFIPFIIIFISGFVIELIGVQTGYLFGDYVYHSSMGPQLFGTPLIIGATWYAVVAGASSLAVLVKGSMLARSVLAGMLSTLMDVLIEQVAVKYGFWQWDQGQIPFFNYVCWFAFATAFSYLYLNVSASGNKIGRYLFFIWIVFFTTLTFF